VSDEAAKARGGAAAAGAGRRASARGPGKASADARKVDLDGLTEHAGYLIRRAQLWIFQDFTRTLAVLDIRPAQYSVLTVINANPGLSQISLSQALGIERARLVHLLDGLEERGFVTRVPSATDRRSHALHLTPEGRRAFVRIRALALEHERRLIERVGLEHCKTLSRLLAVFAHG
jgi:DNA-binding MarR family transcriptional regulator